MTTESRQEYLENHAMAEGHKRFLRRLEDAKENGQYATVGAARCLVLNAIQPLSSAMEQALAVKKRGIKHVAEKIIPSVGPEVAAYITVRTVLNEVLKRQVVGVVALEVADLLLDELRYRRFKDQAPALFDYKMKRFNTSSYEHKSESLNHALRTANIKQADGTEQPISTSDLELTDTQRMALGMWCINLLVMSTDVVDVETHRTVLKGKRVTIKALVAPQETLEWLKDRNEAMQLLWPVAFPMVEPPLPWAPGQRGGYRYALRGKYTLVRGITKAHAKTLSTTPMAPVYAAVNTIQNTAWTLNAPVVDVLRHLIESGGGRAGVPEVRAADLPVRPVENDEFEQQRKLHRKHLKLHGTLPSMSSEMRSYLDGWKAWRKKAGLIKNENHERHFQQVSMARLLSVLDLFKDTPALYFVYNVDFRGRVYPVVGSLLSPQGDDMAKGLLTFAKGRPLGREGRRYLAQHGAACLDEHGGVKFSKLTIAERVKWIESHSQMLCDVATDPLGNSWWSAEAKQGGADSPFCFLAFCIEWHKLQQWTQAGHSSETFVSSLPCAQDGSCNGIQHFSAMLRDPVGGKEVNLTPLPQPQDIYSTVMKRVLDMIEKDAADLSLQTPLSREVKQRVKGGGTVKKVVTACPKGQLAMLWLTSGLVSRKLVKRPVMTYPYGSRGFGFASQTVQFLQRMGDKPLDHKREWKAIQQHFTRGTVPGDVVKDAAQYLAACIMVALETTVVAAAEAMAWLKLSARLIAGAGQCVTWTVPATGFVVRQEYMESKERRVDTVLLGKLYKPVVHMQTDTPHAIKQGNAVAPNVVHSLDAAALMMTVLEAKQDGVESFAMIHDSYGAPAGDCAVLARCTRSAFVKLYTDHQVVEGLHRQLLEQVAEDRLDRMPAMPQQGTLDLSGIHASDFFFA